MRLNEAGADVFTILALVAVRSAMPEPAARMLGHVDAWVARSQYDLAPNEARAAEEAGREIDAAIGAQEHARLRAEGAKAHRCRGRRPCIRALRGTRLRIAPFRTIKGAFSTGTPRKRDSGAVLSHPERRTS